MVERWCLLGYGQFSLHPQERVNSIGLLLHCNLKEWSQIFLNQPKLFTLTLTDLQVLFFTESVINPMKCAYLNARHQPK